MYNNNFNQNNQQNNSMYRIPNRIFVGGIPQTASQDELRDYFGHFGHVKDARIITDTRGNSKGFGFVTYDSENDAMKVLSLKEEELIFKENKLNIGHAFRKKNNFDQPGGQQFQQNPRGQDGQHPMMGGNMGGLGLGGQGSIGLHNGGMGGNGLGNMGGLGGLGGGHLGNYNNLDSQMNAGASGMHPMNGMNGGFNNGGSQGMNPQGMNYGMNGHIGLGSNMGGLGGMNGMNMN